MDYNHVKKVVVHPHVMKVIGANPDACYLLAGSEYNGTARVTDALEIKPLDEKTCFGEGPAIDVVGMEIELRNRCLYPVEPDPRQSGKVVLGTYGICNLSENYGLVVMGRKGSDGSPGLQAMTYPGRDDLETIVSSELF